MGQKVNPIGLRLGINRNLGIPSGFPQKIELLTSAEIILDF